ncbi:hypothetical protein PHMEG_00013649 [Phytophthora megakarya]|uniref:Uncharacterized protein n=1 Tax=Phytophthora megakarya TaxID=4795 RepID=A0A225W7E5_9STRA|nr:hypothetical protein PHMEG_00013649 [Phytophthora megakarya]
MHCERLILHLTNLIYISTEFGSGKTHEALKRSYYYQPSRVKLELGHTRIDKTVVGLWQHQIVIAEQIHAHDNKECHHFCFAKFGAPILRRVAARLSPDMFKT